MEDSLKGVGPPELVLVVEMAGPLVITCSRLPDSPPGRWEGWPEGLGLESIATTKLDVLVIHRTLSSK